MEKKLTKESEHRLLESLEDIADLTNEGMHPNEAITKIASEKQVPAGHIHLLVNAYNIGRTTAQRKNSTDVWEKAAEFPIADTEAILESMFPAKVKKANTSNPNIVSDEYKKAPYWLNKQKELTKQANKTNFDFSTIIEAKPNPREERNLYKEAQDKIKNLQRELEETRYKTSYTYDYAVKLKDELTDYFKSATHKSFNDVRGNAELLYPDILDSLFDQLEEENPRFAKHASTDFPRVVGKPYDLLKELAEVTTSYRSLRDSHTEKLASFERESKELLKPFEAPAEIHPILHFPLEKKADNGAKRPWLTGSLLRSMPISSTAELIASGSGKYIPQDIKSNVKNDMLKERLQSATKNPFGDAHEATINSMQQHADLTDILAHDEVLSQRDPHEVLKAYSGLSGFAPTATQNPEILKMLLRKRVEQGHFGDTFEMKGIADLENSLKKNINMTKGLPTPKD